jgi:hypothetical protein
MALIPFILFYIFCPKQMWPIFTDETVVLAGDYGVSIVIVGVEVAIII